MTNRISSMVLASRLRPKAQVLPCSDKQAIITWSRQICIQISLTGNRKVRSPKNVPLSNRQGVS